MDRMGDKSIETYSDQLSVTLRINKWRVTINLTSTNGKCSKPSFNKRKQTLLTCGSRESKVGSYLGLIHLPDK